MPEDNIVDCGNFTIEVSALVKNKLHNVKQLWMKTEDKKTKEKYFIILTDVQAKQLAEKLCLEIQRSEH